MNTATPDSTFAARVNAGIRALIAHREGYDLSDAFEDVDLDYRLYEIGVKDPEELDALRAEVRAVLVAAEAAR